MVMWGIHNNALGSEPFDDGFISIGWARLGDLTLIGQDTTHLKEIVRQHYPSAKPGAIPVWAGVLRRFAFEVTIGDYVVAPHKATRTLNLGIVEGPYEYHADGRTHPHRRRVRWLKTGVPRSLFPKSALYEIGSAMTLFQVRSHEPVFRAYLESKTDEAFEVAMTADHSITEDPAAMDVAVSAEPDADRIDQQTRDFIARVLLTEITPQEFEEFTAALLRTLGYQARVTQYSQDGGIDVIAHKDPLGVEPPIIKVQCKQSAATRGRPDVQQLIGTLAPNEAGLFVSLGAFSADALSLERERQNLRLLSGADVTDLTLQHYVMLPAEWRVRIPLRQVLVVDRDPTAG